MFGCKAEVEVIYLYPATVNHDTQAKHVERVAKKVLGDARVSSEGLPKTFSEDFSYFLENRPGAFYLLGIKKENE
jgi:metal-dependent amidase/aminoacylase/carboxypeptidase family protein